jgi:hypothetical protein
LDFDIGGEDKDQPGGLEVVVVGGLVTPGAT